MNKKYRIIFGITLGILILGLLIFGFFFKNTGLNTSKIDIKKEPTKIENKKDISKINDKELNNKKTETKIEEKQSNNKDIEDKEISLPDSIDAMDLEEMLDTEADKEIIDILNKISE